MSKFSRSKGQRGEREVIHLLQPVLNEIYEELGIAPVLLQRNTLQSDRGGYDIVGLEDFAIEVKRVEKLNIKKWWEQTLRQTRPGQIPVLFYRQSYKPWFVKYTFDGEVRELDVFLNFLRDYVKKSLTNTRN